MWCPWHSGWCNDDAYRPDSLEACHSLCTCLICDCRHTAMPLDLQLRRGVCVCTIMFSEECWELCSFSQHDKIHATWLSQPRIECLSVWLICKTWCLMCKTWCLICKTWCLIQKEASPKTTVLAPLLTPLCCFCYQYWPWWPSHPCTRYTVHAPTKCCIRELMQHKSASRALVLVRYAPIDFYVTQNVWWILLPSFISTIKQLLLVTVFCDQPNNDQNSLC